MNPDRPRYWFSAKRYGWGWGPPVTWQGWVTLVLWMLVLALGMRRLTTSGTPAHAAFVVVMIIVLLMICCLKGEPPKWRWGDEDRR